MWCTVVGLEPDRYEPSFHIFLNQESRLRALEHVSQLFTDIQDLSHEI